MCQSKEDVAMTLNATEVVTGQEGGKPSGDVLLLILDNRGRACKRGKQTYD